MENNEKKNLNEQEMEQVNGGKRLVEAAAKKGIIVVTGTQVEPATVTMTISEHDDGPQS